MKKILTDLEFYQRWKKLSKKQRKYCLRFIENGLDSKQAAQYAGYTHYFIHCHTYKIQRKLSDVLDYLIVKNKVIQTIVKPAWIYSQYKKIYDNTSSDKTKIAVLENLSKLLQIINDNQININNQMNTPQVIINFSNDEEIKDQK